MDNRKTVTRAATRCRLRWSYVIAKYRPAGGAKNLPESGKSDLYHTTVAGRCLAEKIRLGMSKNYGPSAQQDKVAKTGETAKGGEFSRNACIHARPVGNFHWLDSPDVPNIHCNRHAFPNYVLSCMLVERFTGETQF